MIAEGFVRASLLGERAVQPCVAPMLVMAEQRAAGGVHAINDLLCVQLPAHLQWPGLHACNGLYTCKDLHTCCSLICTEQLAYMQQPRLHAVSCKHATARTSRNDLHACNDLKQMQWFGLHTVSCKNARPCTHPMLWTARSCLHACNGMHMHATACSACNNLLYATSCPACKDPPCCSHCTAALSGCIPAPAAELQCFGIRHLMRTKEINWWFRPNETAAQINSPHQQKQTEPFNELLRSMTRRELLPG